MNTIHPLLARYNEARGVARMLALRHARLRYTVSLYVEDKQHGSLKTGTRAVTARAVVPLMGTSKVHVWLPLGTTNRIAMHGHRPEEVVCLLGVELETDNADSEPKHQFESLTPHSAAEPGETSVKHWFKIADMTPLVDVAPANDPSRDWEVCATTRDDKRGLQFLSVTFEHDSERHPALVDLLIDEATEHNIDTALRLMADYEKVDFARALSEGRAKREHDEAENMYGHTECDVLPATGSDEEPASSSRSAKRRAVETSVH